MLPFPPVIPPLKLSCDFSQEQESMMCFKSTLWKLIHVSSLPSALLLQERKQQRERKHKVHKVFSRCCFTPCSLFNSKKKKNLMIFNYSYMIFNQIKADSERVKTLNHLWSSLRAHSLFPLHIFHAHEFEYQ